MDSVIFGAVEMDKLSKLFPRHSCHLSPYPNPTEHRRQAGGVLEAHDGQAHGICSTPVQAHSYSSMLPNPDGKTGKLIQENCTAPLRYR